MKVLIWESKYGPHLYDASTDENERLSCIEILKDWVGEGYVYPPEDPLDHIHYTSIDLEQANLTDEQIEALPTESLQKEAKKHKANLQARIRQYEVELEDWKQLQQIIAGERIFAPDWARRSDSPDGKHKAGDMMPGKEITPWNMIQQWNGGEYMGVDYEHVWTPGEDD